MIPKSKITDYMVLEMQNNTTNFQKKKRYNEITLPIQPNFTSANVSKGLFGWRGWKSERIKKNLI